MSNLAFAKKTHSSRDGYWNAVRNSNTYEKDKECRGSKNKRHTKQEYINRETVRQINGKINRYTVKKIGTRSKTDRWI